MIEFDEKLWMDRAAARLRRSSHGRSTKEQRAAAADQWACDIRHTKNLAVLIEWCRSRGILVCFIKKGGALYHTLEKKVTLAGRMQPEKQVCVLLHECGHHLIGHIVSDERFGKGYPSVQDSSVNTTFHHRLACLEEEIEAWNRGWSLAKRLNLLLYREEYDRIRVDCLKSYVKWASRRTKITI